MIGRLDRRALLGLLLGAAATTACWAQPVAEAMEYRIKAAFVCKFVSYVAWPPNVFERPDSPIVIGVMATDAVADELMRSAAALPGEKRSLQVRRLQSGDPVDGLHVLYIARSEDAHLTQVLVAAKGLPILVVTESSYALALGSMINFVVVDKKVRFDIAPQVAEPSRLRISARLLTVARKLVGNS